MRESIRLKRKADYFLETLHPHKSPNILAYSQDGLSTIYSPDKER